MKLQEQQDYIASLSNHTDRELLELQTYYARKTADATVSTNKTLYFFFMLTIVGVVVGLVVVAS